MMSTMARRRVLAHGDTARRVRRYVRTRKVISLEEAVRKMTSLPAQHFRFTDRGQIKEGFAADLVVFDGEREARTMRGGRWLAS